MIYHRLVAVVFLMLKCDTCLVSAVFVETAPVRQLSLGDECREVSCDYSQFPHISSVEDSRRLVDGSLSRSLALVPCLEASCDYPLSPAGPGSVQGEWSMRSVAEDKVGFRGALRRK